jgi:hypothetical protein
VGRLSTLVIQRPAGRWRRRRRPARPTAALISVAVAAIVALLTPATASAQTFAYTRQEQMYMVPAGITIVDVRAVGADGGGGTGPYTGGHGGIVEADLVVSPGEKLYVEVGQAGEGPPGGGGGTNGGGTGGNEGPENAFGGGGASDIRTVSCGVGCSGNGTSLASRILVAGGGGGLGVGQGSESVDGDGGNAGEDGSLNFIDGEVHTGGYAGSSTAAGHGGSGCGPAGVGASGSAGAGGGGGDQQEPQLLGGSGGGGGGGGYYGGGGGGACLSPSPGTLAYGGGGGGGSDFVATGATNVSIGLDSTLDANGSVTIAPTAPKALSEPAISGSDLLGQTLTVVHGEWTNSPSTYSYVWYRCDPTGANCTTIPGASGASYISTSEDLDSTIRVQETATNAYGTGNPSTSAATGPLGEVPNATAPPAISGGASQGAVLSESRGTWTGSPSSYTIQWLRCATAATSCVPIGGATGQSYQLTAADVGSTVRVQEVAANAYGVSSPATSAATQPIQPPPTESASISGIEQPVAGVAVQYQASVIDSQGSPNTYKWTVDGTLVGSLPTLDYVFRTAGVHVIVLQVIDTVGNTISAALRVTVTLRKLSIVTQWRDKFSSRWTEFTSLIANNVPIGTHIKLSCTGRGCPFRHHDLATSPATRCKRKRCRGKSRPATGTEVDLTSILHGARLSVGTKLTIAFTHSLYIGQVETWNISVSGPQRRLACLAPGSGLSRSSCTGHDLRFFGGRAVKENRADERGNGYRVY